MKIKKKKCLKVKIYFVLSFKQKLLLRLKVVDWVNVLTAKGLLCLWQCFLCCFIRSQYLVLLGVTRYPENQNSRSYTKITELFVSNVFAENIWFYIVSVQKSSLLERFPSIVIFYQGSPVYGYISCNRIFWKTRFMGLSKASKRGISWYYFPSNLWYQNDFFRL